MKRLSALEARRRMLLTRCDQQRLDIMYRIAQIRPGLPLSAWMRGAPQSGAARGGPQLAWLAALASIVVMLRPRRLISWLTWITGALSLGMRVIRVLRLIQHLRAPRSAAR